MADQRPGKHIQPEKVERLKSPHLVQPSEELQDASRQEADEVSKDKTVLAEGGTVSDKNKIMGVIEYYAEEITGKKSKSEEITGKKSKAIEISREELEASRREFQASRDDISKQFQNIAEAMYDENYKEVRDNLNTLGIQLISMIDIFLKKSKDYKIAYNKVEQSHFKGYYENLKNFKTQLEVFLTSGTDSRKLAIEAWNKANDFSESLKKSEGPLTTASSSSSFDPEPSQPRMFGGYLEPVRLPWTWATEQLTRARNYWIATTRPDGRPHSRPVWGVWLDNTFYFSTGSRAEQNLATNSAITVHLESGNEVVIIEGVAELVSDIALVKRVVSLYNEKYRWEIDPNNLSERFYAVRPQVAFGWLSDASGLDRGATFHGTATRWRFTRPSARA